MGVSRPIQLPLSIPTGEKRQARSQFAALCYRKKAGKVQVMLVTSRRRRRWILPKGWPEHGLTPAQTAEREAFEEAGIKGEAIDFCLGAFSYEKIISEDETLPCIAMVYPVRVLKKLKHYPEKQERKRKWFSLKAAAKRVGEPELKRIIKTFDPKLLK